MGYLVKEAAQDDGFSFCFIEKYFADKRFGTKSREI